MSDKEVFKKFILKQLAGEVAFNKECHSFRLGLRTVSNPIRQAIYEEGHNWNLTDSQIDNLLIKVQDEIELAYAPIERSITHIDVKDMNPGEQLRLHGASEVDGPAELCLLYLGQCRFMVLHTNRRHALAAEDVVELAKTEIISINYPTQFIVYRQGKRIPDDQRVYRTYKLDNITSIKASIVHEIIDARKEFTFLEASVDDGTLGNGDHLSFGSNAMSLLLHEYSGAFPVYADFEENGIGRFYSRPDAKIESSEIRNQLFDINQDSHKTACLRIETETPGELFLKKDDHRLGLKKPAQVKKCFVDNGGLRRVSAPKASGEQQQSGNLEQMAKEIKKQLAVSGNSLKIQQVHQWIDQFRNQRVSIIALEELLNFFNRDPEATTSVDVLDESAFLLPNVGVEDTDIKKCRDEINRLMREKKDLETELSAILKKLRMVSIVALFILLALIISLLYNCH